MASFKQSLGPTKLKVRGTNPTFTGGSRGPAFVFPRTAGAQWDTIIVILLMNDCVFGQMYNQSETLIICWKSRSKRCVNKDV